MRHAARPEPVVRQAEVTRKARRHEKQGDTDSRTEPCSPFVPRETCAEVLAMVDGADCTRRPASSGYSYESDPGVDPSSCYPTRVCASCSDLVNPDRCHQRINTPTSDRKRRPYSRPTSHPSSAGCSRGAGVRSSSTGFGSGRPVHQGLARLVRQRDSHDLVPSRAFGHAPGRWPSSNNPMNCTSEARLSASPSSRAPPR